MPSLHFDSPDADLVLRSGTLPATDFRVHRCILSTSSPFFEDMFSLPQPHASDDSGPPVVEVSESADILEKLLRFIYPRSNPILNTIEDVVAVLEAASKYDVMVAIDALRSMLISPAFVKQDPLRIYAIACRFDLEEEAKIASRYTLSVNVLDSPFSEDLKHITAFQYHQLLNLHKKRAAAAQELLILHEDVKCMMCNGTHYGQFIPPKWWRDFRERAAKELSMRPTSETIFSMAFLAESAKAGCERCAGSILASGWFLDQLKQAIDELPSTI
ncbi:hypothetical protein BDY19DRAFT_985173 [Irpex rosettiformis]|uniref:Uncharacterized protein n=1 Tax=Irpex rosettiformis TaxID=378272 RepID=A0ACB8U4F3_9APHY|nr:hypothetical protein BDY19DRAFT_985173 [Irpex rosettiformis]